MRLHPGLCPGPRWGAYSAPQTPSWIWLGHTPIRHSIPPSITTNLCAWLPLTLHLPDCSEPQLTVHNSILATMHMTCFHHTFMHRKAHINYFVLSFSYMCDIILPPAPFKSCYLARNLKEVAHACSRRFIFTGSCSASDPPVAAQLVTYETGIS